MTCPRMSRRRRTHACRNCAHSQVGHASAQLTRGGRAPTVRVVIHGYPARLVAGADRLELQCADDFLRRVESHTHLSRTEPAELAIAPAVGGSVERDATRVLAGRGDGLEEELPCDGTRRFADRK